MRMKRPRRGGIRCSWGNQLPQHKSIKQAFKARDTASNKAGKSQKGVIMNVTNLQFLAFVRAILDILATSKDLDEARERVAAIFKL